MMVIKVEVHPDGDSSRAREIERLYVWNVSDLADVSDYEYGFSDPRPFRNADGRVTGHRRSDGAWALLHRILGDVAKLP